LAATKLAATTPAFWHDVPAATNSAQANSSNAEACNAGIFETPNRAADQVYRNVVVRTRQRIATRINSQSNERAGADGADNQGDLVLTRWHCENPLK
jgi:hypothetical protein